MKIDLPLSTGYVKHWGFKEAIREIIQNAIDQQELDSENKFVWHYDYEACQLHIKSAKSHLKRDSLLLGNSDKTDNKKLIGKYGEGYKLALLVLTRMGLHVEILNYGAKERWVPSIKMSRVLKGELLSIDIKKHIFTSVPDSDLSFVIGDVTNEMFEELKSSALIFRDYPIHIPSGKGNILLGDGCRGQIYVNGLFVEKINDEKVQYGYDLKSECVELDRDRNTVKSFNLYWTTSIIWKSIKGKENLVNDLLKIESPEVQYICDCTHIVNDILSDSVLDYFVSDHGTAAYPVTNQEEFEQCKKSYKADPVIVSVPHKNMILRSSKFIIPTRIKSYRETPHSLFKRYVIEDRLVELEEISKEWRWKDE